MSKLFATLIAGLVSVTVYAAEPAKKEEKKVDAKPAEKKAEPAKSDAKAGDKKSAEPAKK